MLLNWFYQVLCPGIRQATSGIKLISCYRLQVVIPASMIKLRHWQYINFRADYQPDQVLMYLTNA